MLDRIKLARVVEHYAQQLFVDIGPEYELARNAWEIAIHDPLLIHKIRHINAPWPVPLWQGDLATAIDVAIDKNPYVVAAIDGSQIYPDRHQTVSCFLINIGSVLLRYYQKTACPVQLESTPYLFTGDEYDELGFDFSTDLVNCRRQELEFQCGLRIARHIFSEEKFLILFDGSLIFWHLAHKQDMLKDYFLNIYLVMLQQFYQDRIPVAGYISMPKSKELVNIVRLVLCDFHPEKEYLYQSIKRIVDSSIVSFFLKPHQRSIVFQNRSRVSELYPEHIRPYFFYIHVGAEIGRVEIPSWIAHDEQLVNYVASTILDQSCKGNSYPISLAEAHEQAVIKGPDREFFYHWIQKVGLKEGHLTYTSHKNLHKKRMGV